MKFIYIKNTRLTRLRACLDTINTKDCKILRMTKKISPDII